MQCSVCSHAQRPAIDAAVAAGMMTLTAVAAAHGVSRSALRRHQAHREAAPAPPAARVSAVDQGRARLAALREVQSATVAALAAARGAVQEAQHQVIQALAHGNPTAEAAARAQHQAAIAHVAALDQRRQDLSAALGLAAEHVDVAEQARRQREVIHWELVARLHPELTRQERWVCFLLAGGRDQWPGHDAAAKPRGEHRAAIALDLKERFPFIDPE
jgi:hypothetical protein